jgi:hypothetical protein
MAIAAKAGDGKLIAAFPDVCNSPPSPPAGPIPIPYPNTAMSKDLDKGTKRVRIGGKPAGTKDSVFKTSPLGDEAATKTFGGSLLSHTITGTAYFAAYSMDVMLEGKNAARHLDLMTSNHASYPGSTPPLTELEDMAQQLALLALDVQQCPCCSSTTCSAALSQEIAPGVPREPLSFREFYCLDEVDTATGALSAKAQARRSALASKPCSGGSCPNAGKAERKSDPPCDVYRVLTADESQKNSAKMSAKQQVPLRKSKGLPASKDALAQQVLGNPFATAEHLRATGWSDERMNKEIQIDHTTPRAAGGCPTSETNTHAHAKKCANCKSIDNDLDTWNSQELSERRLALGI